MTKTVPSVQVSGRFWRAGFRDRAGMILEPAGAPEGRWHHSGQTCLYLSATPEGCRVAMKVYLQEDDPPRAVFPVKVTATVVTDLRTEAVREALGIALADIHVFWAKIASAGQRPATWSISDRLRDAGFDGILTPSRSRPDLTHLSLFRWNGLGLPKVEPDGPPMDF
ncbi:RES domain-containing protein [Loktanella sp. IMCC34160]|uniref:RES family NAD+ phosphorylase n=1 Tax=Loktanella sp. IMCC34160 TaxID=2510646 RepID=UPI0010D7E479|nr:RES family NAD+ phosphorylase [Loktanella sp. IMCC34160]RYG90687.1 RES domain-containing protein [Loktanella sp. IMCC34160]